MNEISGILCIFAVPIFFALLVYKLWPQNTENTEENRAHCYVVDGKRIFVREGVPYKDKECTEVWGDDLTLKQKNELRRATAG